MWKRYFIAYKPFHVISLIFLIIFCLYTVLWTAISSKIKADLLNNIKEKIGESGKIEVASIETYGFPGKWGFVLNSVRSSGTVSDFLNNAYVWKWDSNAIQVEINPLNSQELTIVSKGKNNLLIFESKGRQLVKVTLENLESQVSQITKTNYSLDFLQIENSRIYLSNGSKLAQINRAKLSITASQGEQKNSVHSEVSSNLLINKLKIFPKLNVPFGDTITELKIKSLISGNIVQPITLSSVSNWRNDGGTVELKEFKINYGPVLGTASGTLALDKNLQPLVALSLRIKGASKLIQRLVEIGLVPPGNGSLLQIFIKLKEGKGAGLELPLTIQDGLLNVHQIRVMDVPLIIWR
ncbi:MAG: hypothetical protein CMM51_02370 [Rhodospirillaceae bacterium]|nr:hypothetical protein [Rhodospirillaceae bacterium]